MGDGAPRGARRPAREALPALGHMVRLAAVDLHEVALAHEELAGASRSATGARPASTASRSRIGSSGSKVGRGCPAPSARRPRAAGQGRGGSCSLHRVCARAVTRPAHCRTPLGGWGHAGRLARLRPFHGGPSPPKPAGGASPRPRSGARPGSRVPTARCGVSPVAGRSWRSASGAGGSTRWWPTSSTAWSPRTGCPVWRPSGCGRHSCRPCAPTERGVTPFFSAVLSSAAVLTTAAHDKKRCRARLPSAGGRGPTGRGRALKTPSVGFESLRPHVDNEIGLLEGLATTRAIRRLRPDPVSTEELATVMFAARAPRRARTASRSGFWCCATVRQAIEAKP